MQLRGINNELVHINVDNVEALFVIRVDNGPVAKLNLKTVEVALPALAQAQQALKEAEINKRKATIDTVKAKIIELQAELVELEKL